MIKNSTVLIAAHTLASGFAVLLAMPVKAESIPPRQPAAECLELNITDSAYRADVGAFFTQPDKKDVSGFVKLSSLVAPQAKPLTEIEAKKSGKNSEKGFPDDVIYRLQLSALTFVIGFLLAVLR